MKNQNKIAILFCSILSSLGSYAQPSNNIPDNSLNPSLPPVTSYPYLVNYTAPLVNYQRVYEPQAPTVNTSDIGGKTPVVASITNTTYFDGIGRPLQDIFRLGADGMFADLVKVHTYDEKGRESVVYQPFSYAAPIANKGRLEINPLTLLSTEYSAEYPGEQPYSQTLYDNSPMDRITKVMPPGYNWVGSSRGVNTDYSANGYYSVVPPYDEPAVSQWTVGPLNTDVPVYNNIYPTGTLFFIKTTDEDGNITIGYKDKSGRLIAKRVLISSTSSFTSPYTITPTYAETNYIYDDLGNLRWVLTPEALRQSASAGTWAAGSSPVSAANLSGYCYNYYYDERGRVVEKQMPGKSREYMVYDVRDRLIFTQDGNEQAANTWSFTTYDVLNRPTMTGIYNAPAGASRTTLQDNIDIGSYPSTSDLLHYMTTNVYNTYPTTLTNASILTYTYYDDYSNPSISGSVFSTADLSKLTGVSPYAITPALGSQTMGEVTGIKVKVMDPASPSLWNTTTNFYDALGQVIQTQATNHMGGLDITTNQYNFGGSLASSVTNHKNPSATPVNTYVTKDYRVNFQTGETDALYQNIDGNGSTPIFSNTYDDFGRVKDKTQGGGAENDYSYDVRGMLIGINDNFIDAPTTDRYFYEQICFDKGFTNKPYNGNIGGIMWKGYGVSAPKRSYGYTYDKLNRLGYAEFRENIGTPGSPIWDKTATDFTVSNVAYDYNGNLQTMNQRGPSGTGPVDMDILTYNYMPNSNQLSNVTDAGVVTGNPDYKENIINVPQYNYDANGNLQNDNKKGWTATYSYLDKPEQVNFSPSVGSVAFLYDALGNKLRKTTTDAASGTTTVTDYIGPFVYVNNALSYVSHEEGRCRPVMPIPATGMPSFYYDYYIKDHLGNVRSVVNMQETGSGPLTPPTGMGVAYAATMEPGNAGT
ncbi:MAG TPA: DUF6443 domain-containing protein, partial [Flavipsychrobacter sp.]|nr:DUF6443 domain-containing protein [Flavipsychrobacter sp.]